MYSFPKQTCTNCGILGHHFRTCTAPISSYGIIAFQVTRDWNQAECLSSNILNSHIIPRDFVKFLLIQRRNSIGFIEIIRAKYKPYEVNYIIEQIEGTTREERTMLLTMSFQELWKEIWGKDSENKHYRNDYFQAKQKFEQITTGYYVQSKLITLKGLIESTPLLWTTPEWGFPKGRRNILESDQNCAVREFCEESGLTLKDFSILQGIEPIREIFYGNNNIHYQHTYYLACVQNPINVILQQQNESMIQEVGNIGWFSMEEALQRIRITNVEKRDILNRVGSILRTLCPLFLPSSLRIEPSTSIRSSEQDVAIAATQ
jgi:8-oxo-dGTP pyrophosphatase MutT (NUDIX family)